MVRSKKCLPAVHYAWDNQLCMCSVYLVRYAVAVRICDTENKIISKLYVTFYRVMIFNCFVGQFFYLSANHDEGIFAIFDGGYFRHIGPSLFQSVSSDLIVKINDMC